MIKINKGGSKYIQMFKKIDSEIMNMSHFMVFFEPFKHIYFLKFLNLKNKNQNRRYIIKLNT